MKKIIDTDRKSNNWLKLHGMKVRRGNANKKRKRTLYFDEYNFISFDSERGSLSDLYLSTSSKFSQKV